MYKGYDNTCCQSYSSNVRGMKYDQAIPKTCRIDALHVKHDQRDMVDKVFDTLLATCARLCADFFWKS